MTVRFAPLPASKHDSHARKMVDWAELIVALDRRPGEWAELLDDVHTGAANYLNRKYPDYEFTLRNVDNRTHRARIWGRKRPPTDHENGSK